MIRQIVKIDEGRCNGCGLCVSACHEGAIGLVDGKAKLLRDDYCDGLGNCLPACPSWAISFEEREAAAFDKAAVEANTAKLLACGCPSTHAKTLTCTGEYDENASTQLRQWPVQIKLLPINAPYFDGAELLIAADCSAYAYGNFHNEYMKGKITAIACPKLDQGNYSEKLTAILKTNNIKSVTVVRMSVPCCGGIEHAVKTALQNCGKRIPSETVTISTDGQILD
ncbi:MAG: 4Fe-4S binding protein [Deferribacteraceae bacterium]|nr:4Fe-4S binding protein [Deferribacteraceae bacterium]